MKIRIPMDYRIVLTFSSSSSALLPSPSSSSFVSTSCSSSDASSTSGTDSSVFFLDSSEGFSFIYNRFMNKNGYICMNMVIFVVKRNITFDEVQQVITTRTTVIAITTTYTAHNHGFSLVYLITAPNTLS